MKKLSFIFILLMIIPVILFADNAQIVIYKSGCNDYFIADGDHGYYLLEWYGGYDPSQGDNIIGEINSFGMKNVYYPESSRDGIVYVDDYGLSKNEAMEKYIEKCKE